MIEKIYSEARRISRTGLGTISLGIGTYAYYDMVSCSYYPPGWHAAMSAVNSGTATPEQLKLSQSSVSLASICEVNDETLHDLLKKLEAIQ